ncbi:DUF397 domain-containing protein [Amycolatopsis aidingensis]|uniref:DUF397 domain-containing protein n=1 Tax=Amycolatopsis aidingensis TaxID=2842453 RepID=UPI001C0BFF10|nr:DUF397 domain-containing protein [Amycolatopsis aidingensis]
MAQRDRQYPVDTEPEGLRWVRSSASDKGADAGECVEVAGTPGRVLVRDSKRPGPRLSFAPAAWSAFLVACAQRELPG